MSVHKTTTLHFGFYSASLGPNEKGPSWTLQASNTDGEVSFALCWGNNDRISHEMELDAANREALINLLEDGWTPRGPAGNAP